MRNIAKSSASIFVSACLLALTLFLIDARGAKAALFHQLGTLDWRWVSLVVLVCLSNNLLAACRFLLLVRRAHQQVRLWTVLKVNAAALFLATWTPLSIAGDGGRVLWLKKSIVGNYADAFFIVLWDRLIALAALLMCMVPFVPSYLSRAAAYFQVGTDVVVYAALGALAIVGLLVFTQRHRLRVPSLEKGIAGRDLWEHFVVGLLYVATFFFAMFLAAASLGLGR